MFHFAGSGFFALLQVILIDLTLAGDNAVVIGMAASRVPREHRRSVIMWGLAAAVVSRVFLASVTVQLFQIIGFMLAGGILLLWVAWRFFRDIRHTHHEQVAKGLALKRNTPPPPPLTKEESTRQTRRAIAQIAMADISMSLDNVLAVAGASMNHRIVLAIGLLLSIGLMGIAATYVAKLLHRHPWISYAGLFIVVFVAINMVWHGSMKVAGAIW